MRNTHAAATSPRMRADYKAGPAERHLMMQFVVITHDWPRESRESLRDAIVAALDEASKGREATP